MATEDDSYELDNYNYDTEDDFDIDSMLEDTPNGREAADSGLKKIGDAFVDEFNVNEDPNLATDFIKQSLPDEVSTTLETADDMYEGLKGIAQDNEQTFKTSINTIVNAAKNFIPKDSSTRVLLDKVLDWAKPELMEASTNTLKQQRDMETQSKINKTLGTIMSTAEDSQKIANAIALNGSKNQQQLLVENLVSTKRLDDFAHNFQASFYRRSLELQYKHLYVAKDQLALLKTFSQAQLKLMDTVIHNTSLPDIVKTRTAEAIAHAAKAQIGHEITGSVFNPDSDTPAGRLTNRVRQRIDASMAQLATLAGMGSMFDKDTAQSLSVHQMATASVTDQLKILGSELIRDKLSKTKEGRKVIKEAGRANMDLAEYLRSKKKKGSRSRNALLEELSKFVDENVTTASFTVGEAKLNEPAIFDQLIHNSITRGIPTLLSEILASVRTIETGSKQPSQMYNYKTGRLENKEKAASSFTNGIEKTLDEKTYAHQSFLHETIGSKLSEDAMQQFMARLAEFSFSGKSLDPTRLEKNGFFEGMDNKTAKAIKSSIRKNTASISGAKQVRRTNDLYNAMRGIKFALPSSTTFIKDAIRNGTISDLVDHGLVDFNQDTNQYTMNAEKYKGIVSSHLGEGNLHRASMRAKAIHTKDGEATTILDKKFSEHLKHVSKRSKTDLSKNTSLKGKHNYAARQRKLSKWDIVADDLRELNRNIFDHQINDTFVNKVFSSLIKAKAMTEEMGDTEEGRIITKEYNTIKNAIMKNMTDGDKAMIGLTDKRYLDSVYLQDSTIASLTDRLVNYQQEMSMAKTVDDETRYKTMIRRVNKEMARQKSIIKAKLLREKIARISTNVIDTLPDEYKSESKNLASAVVELERMLLRKVNFSFLGWERSATTARKNYNGKDAKKLKEASDAAVKIKLPSTSAGAKLAFRSSVIKAERVKNDLSTIAKDNLETSTSNDYKDKAIHLIQMDKRLTEQDKRVKLRELNIAETSAATTGIINNIVATLRSSRLMPTKDLEDIAIGLSEKAKNLGMFIEYYVSLSSQTVHKIESVYLDKYYGLTKSEMAKKKYSLALSLYNDADYEFHRALESDKVFESLLPKSAAFKLFRNTLTFQIHKLFNKNIKKYEDIIMDRFVSEVSKIEEDDIDLSQRSIDDISIGGEDVVQMDLSKAGNLDKVKKAMDIDYTKIDVPNQSELNRIIETGDYNKIGYEEGEDGKLKEIDGYFKDDGKSNYNRDLSTIHTSSNHDDENSNDSEDSANQSDDEDTDSNDEIKDSILGLSEIQTQILDKAIELNDISKESLNETMNTYDLLKNNSNASTLESILARLRVGVKVNLASDENDKVFRDLVDDSFDGQAVLHTNLKDRISDSATRIIRATTRLMGRSDRTLERCCESLKEAFTGRTEDISDNGGYRPIRRAGFRPNNEDNNNNQPSNRLFGYSPEGAEATETIRNMNHEPTISNSRVTAQTDTSTPTVGFRFPHQEEVTPSESSNEHPTIISNNNDNNSNTSDINIEDDSLTNIKTNISNISKAVMNIEESVVNKTNSHKSSTSDNNIKDSNLETEFDRQVNEFKDRTTKHDDGNNPHVSRKQLESEEPKTKTESELDSINNHLKDMKKDDVPLFKRNGRFEAFMKDLTEATERSRERLDIGTSDNKNQNLTPTEVKLREELIRKQHNNPSSMTPKDTEMVSILTAKRDAKKHNLDDGVNVDLGKIKEYLGDMSEDLGVIKNDAEDNMDERKKAEERRKRLTWLQRFRTRNSDEARNLRENDPHYRRTKKLFGYAKKAGTSVFGLGGNILMRLLGTKVGKAAAGYGIFKGIQALSANKGDLLYSLKGAIDKKFEQILKYLFGESSGSYIHDMLSKVSSSIAKTTDESVQTITEKMSKASVKLGMWAGETVFGFLKEYIPLLASAWMDQLKETMDHGSALSKAVAIGIMAYLGKKIITPIVKIVKGIRNFISGDATERAIDRLNKDNKTNTDILKAKLDNVIRAIQGKDTIEDLDSKEDEKKKKTHEKSKHHSSRKERLKATGKRIGHMGGKVGKMMALGGLMFGSDLTKVENKITDKIGDMVFGGDDDKTSKPNSTPKPVLEAKTPEEFIKAHHEATTNNTWKDNGDVNYTNTTTNNWYDKSGVEFTKSKDEDIGTIAGTNSDTHTNGNTDKILRREDGKQESPTKLTPERKQQVHDLITGKISSVDLQPASPTEDNVPHIQSNTPIEKKEETPTSNIMLGVEAAGALATARMMHRNYMNTIGSNKPPVTPAESLKKIREVSANASGKIKDIKSNAGEVVNTANKVLQDKLGIATKESIERANKIKASVSALKDTTKDTISNISKRNHKLSWEAQKKSADIIKKAQTLIKESSKVGLSTTPVKDSKGFLSSIWDSAKLASKDKGLISKYGSKLFGFAKSAPGLGLLIGAGTAAYDVIQGDYKSAAYDLGSGVLSTVPVVGTGLALGLQGYETYDDMKESYKDRHPKSKTPSEESLSKIMPSPEDFKIQDEARARIKERAEKLATLNPDKDASVETLLKDIPKETDTENKEVTTTTPAEAAIIQSFSKDSKKIAMTALEQQKLNESNINKLLNMSNEKMVDDFNKSLKDVTNASVDVSKQGMKDITDNLLNLVDKTKDISELPSRTQVAIALLSHTDTIDNNASDVKKAMFPYRVPVDLSKRISEISSPSKKFNVKTTTSGSYQHIDLGKLKDGVSSKSESPVIDTNASPFLKTDSPKLEDALKPKSSKAFMSMHLTGVDKLNSILKEKQSEDEEKGLTEKPEIEVKHPHLDVAPTLRTVIDPSSHFYKKSMSTSSATSNISRINAMQKLDDETDDTTMNYKTKIAQLKHNMPWLYSQIGKPYKWGIAVNEKSFKMGYPGYDCSALSSSFYGRMGIGLNKYGTGVRHRTAAGQLDSGLFTVFKDIKQAKAGDLIWFNSKHYGAYKHPVSATHVAIYVGDGWMVHARGKHYGIVLTPVFISNYRKTLVGFGRFKGFSATKSLGEEKPKTLAEMHDEIKSATPTSDTEEPSESPAEEFVNKAKSKWMDISNKIKKLGIDGYAAESWSHLKHSAGDAAREALHKHMLQQPKKEKVFTPDYYERMFHKTKGKSHTALEKVRALGKENKAMIEANKVKKVNSPYMPDIYKTKTSKPTNAYSEASKKSLEYKEHKAQKVDVNVKIPEVKIDTKRIEKTNVKTNMLLESMLKEIKRSNAETVKAMRELVNNIPNPPVHNQHTYDPRKDDQSSKKKSMVRTQM